jgi:ATP-binding cassette subfamily C protein
MLTALKKLWGLLSIGQRLRFAAIVILMTIAASMEMLGVGALLPIISIMQSPALIQTNHFLSTASRMLGSPPTKTFFELLLLALLVFFVVKNAFLVFIDVFQYRFLSTLQSSMSTRLLASYLNRPYSFHLQNNTAQLIRNVTTEVGTIYYFTLVPIVSLVSECLVVLALFLLIVFVDPNTAIVLSILGGILVYSFYRSFKDRMLQIGTQLQHSSGKMIQCAQEGLGGVKEIKVMGREAFFEDTFSQQVAKYARALRRSLVIHNFPMHVLETIFVGMFVAVLILLTVLDRATAAIPLMGVYAAAAFRLIPSLNRILTATNRMKQSAPSLNLVVSELAKPDQPSDDRSSTPLKLNNELTLIGLCYQYPNSGSETLKNISLAIKRGEMVGFVGKSGSGKTTLMDCVLGLLTPTRGNVFVDGVDIQGQLGGWRTQIGYIPQHIYLTDDSLRKNIALGLEEQAIDPDKIQRALEAAQLADFVKELPGGLETTIGERGVRLSGGQRQRIGIARAMYYDPAVLILDEATSALDNETEKAIVNTISGLKRSKTILVIAHRMTTIEDCDRVFVLDKGALVDNAVFEEEAAADQPASS